MKLAKYMLMTSLAAGLLTTGESAHADGFQATRAPVVLFPAFHFTRLEVRVDNQTAFPDCPASGVFEDWYQNPNISFFNQVCRDQLMTLRLAAIIPDTDEPPFSQPLRERLHEQDGVEVKVKYYGKTYSAPYYEDMYSFLEEHGYERNVDIRVAGYDSRLTPDMGGFMERTIDLIEETYYANNQRPVHLVGHSNGPLYAQYLLTHTTRAWKDKFIHGFTPIAGNWPGQGVFYSMLFTGYNIKYLSPPTSEANAYSSARMYESHPSTYMSAADPDVFGDQEVVVRLPGKDYTPANNMELFEDANLYLAKELAPYYTGFVKFQSGFFPGVDVYAEKGSGLETVVGLELDDLDVGQLYSDAIPITEDGDGNQEDITNDAITVWEDMACHRFSLKDNPGIDHLELVSDSGVLQRLLTHLRQPRKFCLPF